MSSSFRRVDYSLRPAKHAERRMLCEIFRKLRPFQAVEDYRYVGLGSLWFSDFVLFHRVLGVKDMISIEKSGDKARFEANKPFRSIVLDHRFTSKALPKLDWSKKQFLWLDYDDQIDIDKLLDAKTVAARASSGTVLAVSVQCESAIEVNESDDAGSAIDRFRTRFGPERVSDKVWPDDLLSWRFAKLSREMLYSEIEAALAVRNSGAVPDEVVRFYPICDIEYADGAKMTTAVGVFAKASDADKRIACGFGELDFLSTGSRLVQIEVPKLTIREIHRLEQLLPNPPGGFAGIGVPVKDAKQYASLYRYLPNFAVLET